MLRLCLLGARVCEVFRLLASGGTLCAVCQWVLGAILCGLCLCVLGATLCVLRLCLLLLLLLVMLLVLLTVPGLVLALVRVLAHSASTMPSEPSVMPAGVLLCNVLLPLRLLPARGGTMCAVCQLLGAALCVLRLCLLGAKGCVVFLILAKGGTLRAVCQLLGVALCVLRLCLLGARVCEVFRLLASGGTLCAVCQWVLVHGPAKNSR